MTCHLLRHLLLLALLVLPSLPAQAEPAPLPMPPPDDPAMQERAPDRFRVAIVTSKGPVVVQVHRAWAPKGADRFYNLVRHGFYDQARFFRVIAGFMAQFGLPADPKVAEQYAEAKIADDPVVASNTRGTISFAMAGPGTRTTQLFINYRDNSRLDEMGFAPFGEVVEGMKVVDQLYAEYGEAAPAGKGPSQARIRKEGNAYLQQEFPELDYVERARIVTPK